MTESWDDRVDRFWQSADDREPERVLAAMRSLVEERAGEPEAVFEWASVHDFLGREDEAIPLYRAALAGGLAGERRSRAVIQLASSLRNVGRSGAAIELLEAWSPEGGLGPAAQAFLALALHDAGRPRDALRVALQALAPTLPAYGRAVGYYADALEESRAQ